MYGYRKGCRISESPLERGESPLEKMEVDAIVIGANGLVGQALTKRLSEKGYPWLGTSYKRTSEDSLKLNILNKEESDSFFSNVSTQAIFHCANLSGGVDFCEQNQEIAEDFHFKATQSVGLHAQRMRATLFFISSDYIFDGKKAEYREEDPPSPLNVYGRLKLKAEKWIQDHLDHYVIIRTTNVYGWDPETVTPNYVMNLYRSLKAEKPFYASSSLFGSPTLAFDLASAMIELFEKKMTGIFHLVGSDYVNRYQWSVQAAKYLDLNASLIKETTNPPASVAQRPRGVRLNTEKFRNQCVTPLRGLAEGTLFFKGDLK